jgi:hypothetical protein
MFVLSSICEYLYRVFLRFILLVDSDWICRVGPIFRFCFMLQFMVLPIPCNTVYIGGFFSLYFYRCFRSEYRGRCNLLYKIMLQFFSTARIHTGAPSSMRGRMAPLYMVLSASSFSPQFSFADLVNACISVEHFLDVWMICSLKVNLLSKMIPRYLMLLTYSKGLLLKYIDTSVFSLLFLLVSTITFDFCSLRVILLSFAKFHILLTSMLV